MKIYKNVIKNLSIFFEWKFTWRNEKAQNTMAQYQVVLQDIETTFEGVYLDANINRIISATLWKPAILITLPRVVINFRLTNSQYDR